MEVDEELTSSTSQVIVERPLLQNLEIEEPTPYSSATSEVSLATEKSGFDGDHTSTNIFVTSQVSQDVVKLAKVQEHIPEGAASKAPTFKQTEEESSPSTSDTNQAALDGWTKDDKYLLYCGIKSKGSKKIAEIQETLPHKTIDQIKAAIAYYRYKADQNPECTSRKLKVRKTKTKPLIPLASWAKLLTDNLSYDELQTDIVSALRLIADLEDIPPPECTDKIDFRKVYHQIADAMEGKALPEDKFITEVMSSCVLDTALVSKPFIKLSAFRHIISSVSFKDKELPVFPRPTPDSALAIVRHLTAQRNYNPLGIAEEHLTPTSSLPVIKLKRKPNILEK